MEHVDALDRGRGVRLLIVALALGLAALPAACGTLSGGNENSNNGDPSATTVFRTITVELATSTSAAPDAGAAPQSAVTLSPDVYEVQAGDYWYGIAKKLNVDVNALWAVNNANARTLLLPGKRLAVPKPGDAAGLQPPAAGGSDSQTAGSTAAPAPTLAPGSAPGSYQIVPGDYWIGIAKKLNVSLNALLQANNATTSTVLLPGKYLKVPKS
jgi:LysM repeat protein